MLVQISVWGEREGGVWVANFHMFATWKYWFQHIRVIRKVMPCWAWVLPLIWCFIPCCPQSNDIFLLNKGMKNWDSGLNAREHL
jgi:hypothetical protein